MLQPHILFLPGKKFSGLRGCSEIVWILTEFFGWLLQKYQVWVQFAGNYLWGHCCLWLIHCNEIVASGWSTGTIVGWSTGTRNKLQSEISFWGQSWKNTQKTGKSQNSQFKIKQKIRSKICLYFTWVANCQGVGHFCPKEHLKTAFSKFPSIWSNFQWKTLRVGSDYWRETFLQL